MNILANMFRKITQQTSRLSSPLLYRATGAIENPLNVDSAPQRGAGHHSRRRAGLGVSLLLTFVLLVGCKEDKPTLPDAKGTPSELLVVIPSSLVGSDIADTLQTITDCDAPGLGSAERIFRTMTIGERGYEKVYKLMHSQLRVELDPSQRKPALGVARDVNARPQLQLVVKASSLADLRKFLSRNRERIQYLILDFQLERYADMLRGKHSKKVMTEMRRLGYDASMPVDMQSAKRGKDFLWASSNRGGDKDINFVFYTLPWSGEDLSDLDFYVQKRDSVMQANIPGPQEGQWMQTSRTPEGEPVLWPMLRRDEDGNWLEVRGLWDMHGGFMGGPFVARVRVDSVARKVVCAEGFVFSPNSAKRDLLRSVEAGLRTLRKL